MKEVRKENFYNKSLLSKYKEFSFRYLYNNADVFDKMDWRIISMFANVDVKFIKVFKDNLKPTLLLKNEFLQENSFDYVVDNSYENGWVWNSFTNGSETYSGEVIEQRHWK